MAAAHRAHRRDAALVRPHRRRPARPVEHRRADHRAHQGRLADLGVQHARHDQPGRARSPRRAHEVGALVVVDASQAVPQLPVDVQSPAAPTWSPSPATRWSARPASACSGAAATCSSQLPPFLGGGEMIETVTMERLDVRRRSRTSSRPARRRSRRPSASARPSTTSTAIGMDNDRRARAGDHGVRAGAARRRSPGLRIIGPTDAVDRGGAISFDARRRPPARRRARCSTRAASPSGPGTTAPSRLHARFGVPALDPGVVLPLHDAGGDRRAGRRAGAHPDATSRWAELMDLDSLYQEIILDHYSTRTTRACASRTRPRCTTSTRPAATR